MGNEDNGLDQPSLHSQSAFIYQPIGGEMGLQSIMTPLSAAAMTLCCEVYRTLPAHVMDEVIINDSWLRGNAGYKDNDKRYEDEQEKRARRRRKRRRRRRRRIRRMKTRTRRIVSARRLCLTSSNLSARLSTGPDRRGSVGGRRAVGVLFALCVSNFITITVGYS